MDDSSAGSRMVASYLVRDGRVAPVRRLVGSGQPRLQPVLEQLLAGPTPRSSRAATRPRSRRACELLGVEGEGTDTVTIDLSTAFGAVSGDRRGAARPCPARAHGRSTSRARPGRSAPRIGEPVDCARGGVARPLAADGRQRRGRHAAGARAVAAAVRPGACRSASHGTSTPSKPSSRPGFAVPRPTTPLPDGEPTIVTASSGTCIRGTFDVSGAVPPTRRRRTGYLVSWFGLA